MSDVWQELQREPRTSVRIDGRTVQRGSRVRLCPRPRGDVFDAILSGMFGIVEGLDESLDGEIQVAVTLEDDPGRDMGEGRYPGHRFFFDTSEVEPVSDADVPTQTRTPRILVAGIGNVFLGDDAFGVVAARELAKRPQPDGVDVRDFGIRGLDLAYALQKDYDAVIFIDATARGEPPGTLYVIDAHVDADTPVGVDTHGMDPVRVLALAKALGRVPARVMVLGCEPQNVQPLEPWSEMQMSLSAPVQAAVNEAVTQTEMIVRGMMDEFGLSMLHDATKVPDMPVPLS